MASFFGEVVTPSYRYIDDESPDYTGTDCGVWEAGAGLQLEKSLLVITEGEIAGSYAQLWGGVEEVGGGARARAGTQEAQRRCRC